MDGEPRRSGEGDQADGIIVHLKFVDCSECRFQMLFGLGPSPPVHGQQGELGLADHEVVGVGRDPADASIASSEELDGPVDVPHQEVRLACHCKCRVAPWAPRRLGLHGEIRVGHRLLGAGGTHEGSQHGPCRFERRRTVRKRPIE